MTLATPLATSATAVEPPTGLTEPFHTAHQHMGAVTANISTVIKGQNRAITMIACALFSAGHALLEDLPGSGKTTLARACARSLGGSFARVQATADLLPADITGSAIWQGNTAGAHGQFQFIPGPLFANVVLVDELNRTSPRTQSAFLEALDEAAVSVDGQRHTLPDPFFVIATQNPQEHHGTFPLPQAQLDRFAVSVRLEPLPRQTEADVIRDQLAGPTVDQLAAQVGPSQLAGIRTATRKVYVSDPVLRYATDLVTATRNHPGISHGASTRAAISLLRTAQAHSLLRGRDYTTPDDVKAVASSTLAHRVELVAGNTTGAQVMQEVLARTPLPTGQ